jgi:Ca2+/Na+ antiporter
MRLTIAANSRPASLIFNLFWLGGVCFMFWIAGSSFYASLRAYYVYHPASAVVTASTPTAPDAFGDKQEGSFRYSYVVDGVSHEGSDSADKWVQAAGAEAAPALPPAIGDNFTVYYDPDRPSANTLRPVPQVEAIAGAMFLTPFLVIGLSGIIAAFRPKKDKAARPREGTGVSFASSVDVYFILSALAAFFIFLIADKLPWQAAVGLGLGLWWVGLPLLTLVCVRLGLRIRQDWQQRKKSLQAAARKNPPPAEEPALEGRPADGVVCPPRLLPATRNALLKIGVFVAIWCGMVGLFAGYEAVGLVQNLDAQRRFVQTEGEVVASKVEAHSSGDSTTYYARILYRYAVDGHEFTSERFAFPTAATNEGAYWQQVVASYPAGKHVPVYYDPEKPSEAVLSKALPGSLMFGLLFYQPFLLLGLAGLVPSVLWFVDCVRIRLYVAAPRRPPCAVPTWGRLVEHGGGLTLIHGPVWRATLADFAMGYGLACLGLILVVGIARGIASAEPAVVGVALAIATAVGVGWAIRQRRRTRGRAIFCLEPSTGGTLSLTGTRRNTRESMAEIAGWAVIRVAAPPRRFHIGDTAMLMAVRNDGSSIPLHVFSGCLPGYDQALAQKVALDLADLTGKPWVDAPDNHPATPQAAPTAGGRAKSFRRGRRSWRDDYGDLT